MSCDEARANKVKLTGDPVDAERVRALRRVRPDVWLGVDVNEGFRKQSLEALLPVLIEVRVELIEQPLPVGEEAQFNGMKCPIRIVADLSVRTLSDIPGLVSGIKLDRCGGLSYRLTMPRAARELWPEVMVDTTCCGRRSPWDLPFSQASFAGCSISMVQSSCAPTASPG